MQRQSTRSGTGWVAAKALLLAVSVGCAALAVAAPQDREKTQTINPRVFFPLNAAQEAVRKENWDEALKHLREAQKAENRSSFDDYQIDETLAFVLTRKGEYAEAAQAFERGLNSGHLPEDRVEERLKLLMQLNYEIKDYAKAAEFGSRMKTPDAESLSVLGRAQYLNGEHEAAIETMDRTMAAAREAGIPTEEAWLQVQLSSYAHLKNTDGITASLERLAKEFPKKKYWDDYLRIAKRRADMDPRATLNLYRLMFDTGFMQEPDDYVQIGRLAMRMGLPGEALTVLEDGKNRNMFAENEAYGDKMLANARKAAQADRNGLASFEKEAQAAANGEADVQLGMAYMTYGRYEEAVEAIKRGQEKGGLKHPAEADLVLGRLLWKLDRKEEAREAFERVAGVRSDDDPLRRQLGAIADLWLVYLREPSAVTT